MSTFFFPVAVEDKLISIVKASADISKDFFEEYGGMSIMYVHKNAEFYNNTFIRHHGLYIDISPMLSQERFLRKLKDKIDILQRAPACIIYPPHVQGKEFVDLINDLILEKFGYRSVLFCFSELDIEPPKKRKEIEDFIKNLKKDDWVLVADDVSVTGARLHTYQKSLFTLGYSGKIYYLVGVARPESTDLWSHRAKILTIAGSRLEYVEQVILPDWNFANCPWCQEKTKLEELIKLEEYKALPVFTLLQDRKDELARSEGKGLSENVYCQVGRIDKSTFLGGSIFCTKKTISEADLTASVASTIQQLRNGVTIKGVSHRLEVKHPFYMIIDHRDYLNGDQKFFEPLIKAAIIRSSRPGELYATLDSNRAEQKKFIQDFLEGVKLSAEQQTFFIYELYLAMKLGKLPKPNVSQHLRNIINSYFVENKAIPIEKIR